MRKISQEEATTKIINECQKKNIIFHGFVGGEYKSNRTKLILECQSGHIWKTTSYMNFFVQDGCPRCAQRGFKMNREEAILNCIEACNKNGGEFLGFVDDKWLGTKNTRVILKCSHGHIWDTTIYYSLVNANKWCPKCAKNYRYSDEELHEMAIEKHGDRFDYSNTIWKTLRDKILIHCNICGNDFEQYTCNHIRRGDGCPHCNKSRLEREVMVVLKKLNIKYYNGYRELSWLVNPETNYKLELDFYLPDYNIGIECQGKQHLETKPHGFFKEEALLEIQHRDKIKKQLCEDHKLPLYYINYNDNVEEILSNILNNIF
jgi:hypothetical protein